VRFTGKEQDPETGLHYFGARYDMSALARWASADPLSEKHPEWTPYNYVLNNPPALVDPDGRQEDPNAIGSGMYQVSLTGQPHNTALERWSENLALRAGNVFARGSQALRRIFGTLFPPAEAGARAAEGDYEGAAFMMGLSMLPGGGLAEGGALEIAGDVTGTVLDETLPARVAETFEGGRYTAVTLDNPLLVSRTYGDLAEKEGSFLALQSPLSEAEARTALQLPWANAATHQVQATIKAGTKVFVGQVAGGSGTQVFVYDRDLINVIWGAVRELVK
jgi:RHS repeat-associated protein